MNHLIAKTKGREGDYYKVISDENIYELPDDLDNPKPYDTNYKLEDDEWFSIDDFSNQSFCLDVLVPPFASTDFEQIKSVNHTKIAFLFSYQSDVYYFQKIGAKHFIRKKVLSLNKLTLTNDEPMIVFNKYADAIYLKKEDRLYFKRLTNISSIFKGIEILYREATEEETETFLQSSFIKLENDYGVEKVKKANRKRIAMAVDTISSYKPKEKKEIFKYIKSYCEELKFDAKDSSFKIQSEDDLKKLLFGIEQRYYTTILGGKKRLANSITALN